MGGRYERIFAAICWKRLHKGTRPPMEKHMFQVKEINKAPFEEDMNGSRDQPPRAAVPWLHQRRGLYESLKDYNENASLWVAWFEGEKPPISRHSSNRDRKAEASVEE